ncbi:MAG: hypothetical protein JWM21_2134 [Acidobacteria bacterium]|nr:hypothetical protein [Acidobacteriota bacterium]
MSKMPLRKFICLTFLATILGNTAHSQNTIQPGTAVIQQRRIVLTRSRTVAREFPDRKTAIIRYPVVKGLEDAEVLRKVQKLLAVENAFGSTLKEYREDAWLTDINYKVGYNRNYLLDVMFSQSGMGAYPDTQTKHFLIDLKSGSVIKAADAFNANLLARLASLVNAKLQNEVRATIRRFEGDKDSSAEEKESLRSTFADLRFTEENLDEFSVSPRGITFLFDAGFPHAIRALQPAGQYFFPFSTLQTYIKRDGPLGVLRAGNLK